MVFPWFGHPRPEQNHTKTYKKYQVSWNWGIPNFPENLFCWGSFFKMDFRRRPFNQKPLVFRGDPKTNLEPRGPIWRYMAMRWVSNISPKNENRLPSCPVRPNPAKVRGNLFVWSMPSPRTPPDLPNIIKLRNIVFVKNMIFQFFCSFCVCVAL